MRKTIHVGQLCGIPIQLQYSWFLLFGLFSWLLAYVYFPTQHPYFSLPINLSLGILGSIFLFVSVVLHELAHSLVARKNGLNIHSITLFIFGGVAQIQGEPESPKTEFKMAAAGPALSLLLALFYLFLHNLNPTPASSINAFLYFLFTFNLMLAIFNLTPAFPMDGGRILHAGIWYWKKNLSAATRIASTLSLILAVIMIVSGIYLIYTKHFINGMWLASIGLFLRRTVITAFLNIMMPLELSHKPIKEFMTKNIKTITPEISLKEAWDSFLSIYHFESFPVLSGSCLIGLLVSKDVKQLSGKVRQERTVKETMLPLEKLYFASPLMNAYEAWQEIRHTGKERLLIVEDNNLLGIITASDLERRMAKL